MFTQTSNAICNAANGKKDVCSGVAGLFYLGCPTNVVQLVAFAVVNSFKAPAALSFANILKEINKRLPSLANRYASAAVVFVALVSASAKHSPPHLIYSGVSHAMRKASSYSCLSDKAAARSGGFFENMVSYGTSVSALAYTQAHVVFMAVSVNVGRRIGNYFELSKGLSYEAGFVRHGIGSFSATLVAGARRQPALAAIIDKVASFGQCIKLWPVS